MSSKSDDLFPPDAGYIYAMINPAWPGLVKLGLAGSVKRRFFSYQTGDPHRAYRMIGWSDVLTDIRDVERAVHESFKGQRIGDGEWFRITDSQALTAINRLRRAPMSLVCQMPADAPFGWYEDDGE